MPSSSRLELGVGVIATGGIDLLWHDIADLVEVVEVEPQTVWDDKAGDGRQIGRAALAWLLERERPLLSHGVGFPVGGTCAPDLDGVRAAARSARDIGALHWSEHLSFNRVGGPGGNRYAGYLLPPVPTPESVVAAIGHIGLYQDQGDRPFLVETPTSYVRAAPGDLPDGQFVADIADGADCGILLDLHNIWANELNGRQPVDEFLAQLPLDRVREVHVAGGDYLGECYLDSHVGRVAPELLDLARRVLPQLPNVRAVLFEAVPHSVAQLGVDGVRGVLADLDAVAATAGGGHVEPTAGARHTGMGRPGREPRGGAQPTSGPPAGGQADGGLTAEREAALLDYTTRAVDRLRGGPDPGADVLRHLTDQARLSLLVGTHRAELATMLTCLGVAGAREALGRFLAAAPASAWRHEQGAAFDAWFTEFAATTDLTVPASAQGPAVGRRESTPARP